ncbi:anti-sigma factor family protein [Streptomyces sp. NPDC006739]|uniref:anti-sigma factor family protein n=1 Tax=Streptomyces sp. NPDC006739 TaxID=3364763 RepID=UPI00369FDA71
MTSSTDTAGHPDVAEISDLTEGLLPPSRTSDLRRHLETCELCADVHASLEEIRGLLGTAPAPPLMPADVAGRIDAALAAEALLNASAPESMDSPVLVSASGSSAEDAPARVSRETSTSADRPSGRPHAATGPGRKERGRGRRRRTVVLGAVLTVAVLGAGTLIVQSLGNDSSDTTAHGTQTPSAGTFSGGSIEDQVKGLLSTKRDTQHPSESQKPNLDVQSQPNTPGSAESANTLLQKQVPVPDCVRQGINLNTTALGAKTGTYEGKSAYLVVVPESGAPHRVTAYVVDASCIGRQPVSPGKVLLKQSLPRS